MFEEDILKDCKTIDDLDRAADKLEASYRKCLEFLKIDESLSADDLSYNMWVTPRMMFIGVREEELF